MNERVGTVIEGTLRTEDLIIGFTEELERIAPKAADEIKREYASVFAAIERGVFEGVYLADPDFSDYAEYLVNEILPDALDREAPEGHYFGAHPGDGSDFGFWPC